jgi:hypothetical protein
MANESPYKLDVVTTDTVDGQCVELICSVYKLAMIHMYEHYIEKGGDGAMKGAGLTEMFVSLVVSSIGSALHEVAPETSVFAAQEIATALIEFTRSSQKFRKENPEVKAR